MDIVYGIIILGVGLSFLVFNNKLSNYAVRRWENTYPDIKQSKKTWRLAVIVTALNFIIAGSVIFAKGIVDVW